LDGFPWNLVLGTFKKACWKGPNLGENRAI